MTEQELGEIEDRIRWFSEHGGSASTCLEDSLFGDALTLLEEIWRLKLVTGVLAAHIANEQCLDKIERFKCAKSHISCKDCWLDWARKEAEREEK